MTLFICIAILIPLKFMYINDKIHDLKSVRLLLEMNLSPLLTSNNPTRYGNLQEKN